MVSLIRTLRNFRRAGVREWWKQMWSIGDAKYGRLVGSDQFGNRFYENLDASQEIPGRHRWVDFKQSVENASQIPPEWHSWLNHIRKDPPTEDPIVQASTPPWKTEYHENLTGTRGRYITYSTTAPKTQAWQPQVRPRGQAKREA
ncbi:NADH ubiquinone oxidoreductase subunit NDUFA12-domain-containing protein [Kockovaella imperatae]|uniref:NADH dehydrogenase [ubiquinone] 1 alpha subcomplex subunit n=1 Tax=Kockovaella imperatae TaxID=4999 RepID=A0A1Y1UKS4_9TREE|nr:NADH ubiquinone oxidoreductase subunit NDUFA12-domain-containing protein [Kockovaella imperatae]ORX38572.1 NADH ubiquinone oxidoreductase subunit NDUFA12-domain-containing protein [Kockovaella imperatae]